ncbi:MAG: 30S ribosomal protein S20 [Deltaproteobacteria bacterium]|nr:MAG: 30S ribosomal protein S20 [Deltaproteobacteria bacterium]
MPVHKSARKRMRQNIVRRMRNRHMKTTIRTMTKRVREAVQQRDIEGAKEALSRAIPLIDKAVSKGVLHWRNAARKVSRLSKLVNSLSSGS